MRRAALFALAFIAAACGGGCGGGSRDALGGGASFVPPNAVAFVAARTDADWRGFARQVLHRAVPRVAKDADEVDLAVLQGGKLVVLTHANGAWTGGSAPRKPSLTESAHYADSLDALPKGAVAQAYVRGDLAAARLRAIPGEVVTASGRFTGGYRVAAHPQRRFSSAQLQWKWGAAWLTEDGLGAVARSAGPPLAASNFVRSVQLLAPPHTPLLFDEIPADVVAVVDVPVPLGTFQAMRKAPVQLARLFPKAGFALLSDLDAIISGETALYARRGGEITLVTSPTDVRAAEKALDDLLSTAPPAFHGITVHRAEIGGQLVLSTTAAGIAAFRGGGAKLSGDSAFERAGFPDQAELFAFVRTPYRGVRPLAAWTLAQGRDATYTVHFLGGSR